MFRSIGDLEIFFEVSGQGPPLVLVHGGGVDSLAWEWLVPRLTPHFTVYAMDLRGFGQTVRPPEPLLSQQLWVDDLRGFLEGFDLHDAALAGWSLGGAIITRFAAQNPGRTRALVAMGAAGPRPVPTDRSGFELRQQLAESGAPIEEIIEKTWEFTKAAHSPYTVQHNPEALEKLRQTLLRNEPTSYAEMVRAVAGPVSDGDLAKIECPTLVLCGDADGRTPLQMSRDLHAALPNSLLRIIPDCGHYYPYEQPEATSRAMIEFLRAFG